MLRLWKFHKLKSIIKRTFFFHFAADSLIYFILYSMLLKLQKKNSFLLNKLNSLEDVVLVPFSCWFCCKLDSVFLRQLIKLTLFRQRPASILQTQQLYQQIESSEGVVQIQFGVRNEFAGISMNFFRCSAVQSIDSFFWDSCSVNQILVHWIKETFLFKLCAILLENSSLCIFFCLGKMLGCEANVTFYENFLVNIKTCDNCYEKINKASWCLSLSRKAIHFIFQIQT